MTLKTRVLFFFCRDKLEKNTGNAVVCEENWGRFSRGEVVGFFLEDEEKVEGKGDAAK